MTPDERWEKGIPHHDQSEALVEYMKGIASHDEYDMLLASGGDGDPGEILMFLMDGWFEDCVTVLNAEETRLVRQFMSYDPPKYLRQAIMEQMTHERAQRLLGKLGMKPLLPPEEEE